jgi:hypothetical protein
MHVISKCSGEQPNAIATFLKDLVSLLEYRNARSFEIAWIDGDIFFLRRRLQPIIQPANHDRADGAPMLATSLPSFSCASSRVPLLLIGRGGSRGREDNLRGRPMRFRP